MCYVKTTRILIYISDATFPAIQNLYPYRQAFPGWLIPTARGFDSRGIPLVPET